MQVLLFFLFCTAGVCFLCAAYYLLQNIRSSAGGALFARGIIIKLKNDGKEATIYHLTVGFTAQGGSPVQAKKEVKGNERWYEGMPVLIRYRHSTQAPEVVQIMSYRKAYAKPAYLCLVAIMLIITGVLFLQF